MGFNGDLLQLTIPRPSALTMVKSLHFKYADDRVVAVQVDLKTYLTDDHVMRPFPLTFHE